MGSSHLSVGVLEVLIGAGVVILLYEAKVLVSLPLQHQVPALHVGREVALERTTIKPIKLTRERKKIGLMICSD